MTTSRRFRCRIGLGWVPGSASVRAQWTLLLVLEFRKIGIIELPPLLRHVPRRPRRGSPFNSIRVWSGLLMQRREQQLRVGLARCLIDAAQRENRSI